MSDRPAPESLVLLTVCRDQVEAMTVRSLLEAEGIEVLIQGEHHRALEGSLLAAAIELRAMVRFADLDDARELLEELAYAEHLPAEPLDADADDKSLQQFQQRAPAPTKARAEKSPVIAGVLALVIPFGAGHAYAGRSFIGGAIGLVQFVNIALALQGWNVWRVAIAAVVFDVIFSGVAIRHAAAREALDD
ncbi:MAG: DUF2007 domain-containing protein [Myxococcota bacterium]